MIMKHKIILGLSVLVLVVLLGLFYQEKQNESIPQNQTQQPTVSIANKVVLNVVIAQTAEEKRRGLGGYEHLADTEGMLFPNNTAEQFFPPYFWMKGMLIPIDIIWIKNNTIIKIDKNAEPEPGVSDYKLKLYSPGEPVDYVLEVRGGLSDEFNYRD